MLIDSHIHLHEYPDDYIRGICGSGDIWVLAVSDDLDSSERTLRISGKCSNILPAAGIHPWKVEESSFEELESVIELSRHVSFLGEIGLDKRFVPQSFKKQLEFFNRFLEVAEKMELGLSVHAAGAWKDVLEVLTSYNVKRVALHWFTGPLHLIKRIEDLGFYIGVNAAIIRQAKMRRVAIAAPLKIILTESDGPYNYRGLKLGPELIPNLIKIISEVKGVSEDLVREEVMRNFKKFAGLSETTYFAGRRN